MDFLIDLNTFLPLLFPFFLRELDYQEVISCEQLADLGIDTAHSVVPLSEMLSGRKTARPWRGNGIAKIKPVSFPPTQYVAIGFSKEQTDHFVMNNYTLLEAARK